MQIATPMGVYFIKQIQLELDMIHERILTNALKESNYICLRIVLIVAAKKPKELVWSKFA